ncbi:MAG TPA: esterase-like activity of phytase family protein [Trichocoleus sp.]|jgi:hypothetical protein
MRRFSAKLFSCLPLRLPRFASLLLPIVLLLTSLLTSCSLPQIKAEDRLFLNLSLDYLDEYRLPKGEFAETPVGGLSGISYDRQQDRFYAVSDDRSERAPARFYTLKLAIGAAPDQPDQIGIQSVEVERVTTLKGENGQPFAKGTIDLEGIALSPRRSVFVASEGVVEAGIPPFVDEFDLETGNWRKSLPIPKRFIPEEVEGQPSGVQNNRGFESLTLNLSGSAPGSTEPFRLFAATEAPIQQDLAPAPSETPSETLPETPSETQQPLRFVHYLVGEDLPSLLAEHIYLIDPPSAGATENGLVEMVTLDQGGHFLGLERSFGIAAGVGAKLYQFTMGGATDTSSIPYLHGDIAELTPIYKRLLLDLSDLKIPLDNLEGMTLGPQLPDGNRSLILVSDDNFNDLQVTQFLLFRLKQGRSGSSS